MPISYELSGIWTLMNWDQATAFLDALIYLEGIDLNPKDPPPYLDAMHMTVTTGSGDPLVYDSRTDSKALLILDKIEVDEIADPIKTANNLKALPVWESQDRADKYVRGVNQAVLA